MEPIDTLRRYGIATATLETVEYQRLGDEMIFLVRVAAPQAVTTWEVLRNILPDKGYWPVLGWDRFKQPHWKEEPSNEIIEDALHLDVQNWFHEDDKSCSDQQVLLGDLENGIVAAPFTFRIPSHRFPFTDPGFVPIALVPSAVPWKVPAFLRFTDDSQPPHIHVAVLKFWYERWGAELVGWDSANAELRVLRPPDSYEVACKLAVEQYQYCPDLIEQHIGSIAALAQLLIDSRIWWFWWD